jgi:hypothetical protein
MKIKRLSATKRILLIWLLTHVFAILTYMALIFSEADSIGDPISIDSLTFFFIVIILGLVFSVPAIFLLVPLVSVLIEVPNRLQRLSFGFFGILILCALVLFIFCATCIAMFGQSVPSIVDLIRFLFPYIIGAELAALLILWNGCPGSTEGNSETI